MQLFAFVLFPAPKLLSILQILEECTQYYLFTILSHFTFFCKAEGENLYISTGNNMQTAMLHLQQDEATSIYNCEDIAIGNLFHRATDLAFIAP